MSTPATIERLSVKKLVESPTNPRKTFDPIKLKELADSITAQGLLQPIVVRPHGKGKFEIVFGHRRYKAALLAQVKEIDCQVRELSDEQVIEMQLIENCQREDVHPLEESESICAMIDQGFYDSPQAVADKIGRPVDYIRRRMVLADLVKPLREKLESKEIPVGFAELAATLPGEKQNELFSQMSGPWALNTVRTLREWIKRQTVDLTEAPFDIGDKDLLPRAGACLNCPHNRAADCRMVFGESEQPMCENRKCYDEKRELFLTARLGEIESEHPDLTVYVVGREGGTFAGREILEEYSDYSVAKSNSKDAVPALIVNSWQQKDVGTKIWIVLRRNEGEKKAGVTTERKAEIKSIKTENLYRQKLYQWCLENIGDAAGLKELVSPFLFPLVVHLRRTFSGASKGNAKHAGPIDLERRGFLDVGSDLTKVARLDPAEIFTLILDYAAEHEVPFHDYHKPDSVLLDEFAEHLGAPKDELRADAEYELMSKKEKAAHDAEKA